MFDPNPSPPSPLRAGGAYQASGWLDGVIIPLVRAVFLGVTAGILGGLLVWAFGSMINPFQAGLIVAFAVMMGSFLHFSSRAQWLIEAICGVDLNRDGQIGIPQAAPAWLPEAEQVHISLHQGNETDRIDLPVSTERLIMMAPRLLDGTRQFTYDTCVGRGRLVERREDFVELRDAMLKGGLLRWKGVGKNAGLELTAAGRGMLRHYAQMGITRPSEGEPTAPLLRD